MPRAEGTRSKMARGALLYAAHGWHVFPCIVNGKKPGTTNGFKDATTDAATIERWWQKPLLNVAIATGAVSGLWVLDLDVKHPHCWDELRGLVESRGQDYDELRECAEIVRTASGGEHWYFAFDKAELPITIGAGLHGIKGVDWRADGGYVVAPPSTVDAGEYTWVDFGDKLPELQRAPRWFEELLLEKASGENKPAIAELKGAIVYEGENRFRALQQMAGHYLGIFPDQDAAFCALVGWSSMHCRPPYEFDRVRAIFDGILKEDRRNNPEREKERQQYQEVVELLGDDSTPTLEEMAEARRANRFNAAEIDEMAAVDKLNGHANGTEKARREMLQERSELAAETRRARQQEQIEADSGDDDREVLDEEAATEEVRKRAAKSGLFWNDGTREAGFARADNDLHAKARATLSALLRVDVTRWIRYTGKRERYVLVVGGNRRIEIGNVDSVMSSALFARRLYDGPGVMLTKYARLKGWQTVLQLLFAIREDLDAEYTERDEAIELLRAACAKEGIRNLDGLAGKDFDRTFKKCATTIKGGGLRVPTPLVKRAADKIYGGSLSFTDVRKSMQCLEAVVKRCSARNPVGGAEVRQVCYLFESWETDWVT